MLVGLPKKLLACTRISPFPDIRLFSKVIQSFRCNLNTLYMYKTPADQLKRNIWIVLMHFHLNKLSLMKSKQYHSRFNNASGYNIGIVAHEEIFEGIRPVTIGPTLGPLECW